MIFYGRYLSPFARRAHIVLQLLGIEYEQTTVGADAPEVAEHNPLRRVPTVVLSDGEVLIDSAAIIDHALEVGDAEHRLLPASGADRRAVLRLSAIATGLMEKSVGSAYERGKRPKEKIHQEWLDQIDSQVIGGLTELDRAATGREFLFGDHLTLADINAVVAYDFVAIAVRYKLKDHSFDALAALSERCNQLPAFESTQHKPG